MKTPLVELWRRIIVGDGKAWALFESGTCVIFSAARSGLAEAAVSHDSFRRSGMRYAAEVSLSTAPPGTPKRLPPTTPDLTREEARPYFLWWLDCTVADFKRALADVDEEKRAYYLGALLREANTRDVWLFTTPEQVRGAWPRVVRHLGRARSMWAWLLGLPEPEWPPDEAPRLSRDLDLFCHDASNVRDLVRELPAIASEAKVRATIQRDSGTFVRIELDLGGKPMAADLVHEAVPDIEGPPPPIESVVVESLVDLRASKITCLLSRVEPRDLVDLLFLERSGFSVEKDLELALRKDNGIDPGVLAWLLRDFAIEPLPVMLEPLSVQELRAFRDDLAERLRRLATG